MGAPACLTADPRLQLKGTQEYLDTPPIQRHPACTAGGGKVPRRQGRDTAGASPLPRPRHPPLTRGKHFPATVRPIMSLVVHTSFGLRCRTIFLSRVLIDDKAPLGPCQGPDLRPESLQKVPWIATKSALDHDNDGRSPLPACLGRSAVLTMPGTRPPLHFANL